MKAKTILSAAALALALPMTGEAQTVTKITTTEGNAWVQTKVKMQKKANADVQLSVSLAGRTLSDALAPHSMNTYLYIGRVVWRFPGMHEQNLAGKHGQEFVSMHEQEEDPRSRRCLLSLGCKSAVLLGLLTD